MKPYGREKKVLFNGPGKTDCHPKKGFINWWENMCDYLSRGRMKQLTQKGIDDELAEAKKTSELVEYYKSVEENPENIKNWNKLKTDEDREFVRSWSKLTTITIMDNGLYICDLIPTPPTPLAIATLNSDKDQFLNDLIPAPATPNALLNGLKKMKAKKEKHNTQQLPERCPNCYRNADYTNIIKKQANDIHEAFEYESDAWFCKHCGGLVGWIN